MESGNIRLRHIEDAEYVANWRSVEEQEKYQLRVETVQDIIVCCLKGIGMKYFQVYAIGVAEW